MLKNDAAPVGRNDVMFAMKIISEAASSGEADIISETISFAEGKHH